MNSLSILIVEDELLIAKNLARKLEKLGYSVVDIVTSGEKALHSVAEMQPDLILMDIAIKGEIDGIETAAKINENRNIPIIYTTAYADDDTLERADKTYSYGYLIKPFKEKDLQVTIKRAIKKHQEDCELRELLAQAKETEDDKSRYLSIISHDLRTPLTAIQSSAELLEHYSHKFSEEKKSKHFNRIYGAAKTMTQMLEDMLMLSKAESGKLELKPKALDGVDFVRELVEEFKAVATNKHTLAFQTSAESLPAYLDEKLLRHILANLLSNAIKYSPEGGTITVSASSEEGAIALRVSDEGIGIPPEHLAKLFDRFERASNVGSIKGIGLGLSIVKQAVELQGGKITVESEVGKGTTFIVTLPENAVAK
ncbi:hybrid sensor histidine kinase/response regulator [Phormidium sp. CCY1219]|uniref:hybrid sensor histidine kinase/response regulator n=1 Tax=Phormidium sp. CCY1219 TaxID=2886104 RepID=UPI002D1F424F|nr:ATP-binding protein [Phormidium sp. CCY1219]MEB3827761.1 response regulator [Phormidium sp. CCY1219]